MEKVSKFTKALVKGVQSGDCLLLSGKIPKNGDVPEELTLYLTGVQAPHCGNSQKARGRGLCLGEQGLPSKETRRKGSNI